MSMRVAGIQADIRWENPGANFLAYAPRIAAAAAAGADLVLLPEMYSTGFSMAAERLAEPQDGPSTSFLVEQASRNGVYVAGSLPERTPGYERPTNTLVLASPTGVQARYAKIHPFSYSGEDEHYSAGTTFVTERVAGALVTFFICYDLRFADEFWATAQETDCYVVLANWPRARRRHWETLLTARAIENQAYVAAVNRVGVDGNDIEYSGDSAIIDPLGYPLATAAQTETMLLADVDPEEVDRVRPRFPFMADRR